MITFCSVILCFSRVKRVRVPGRPQAACVRPGSSMGARLAICLPLLMLATPSELSAQGKCWESFVCSYHKKQIDET